MPDDLWWMLAAFGLIFIINVVPAFMPSSWMVMAFFYIRFGLPLLPLTIGGALVSGLGRIVLAKASTAFSRRYMRDKETDLDELGRFLDERRRYTVPVVFVYALTPLPTNNLFIAAGMTGINLVWVLAGFWSARILADTVFVWSTSAVFSSVGDVFERAINGPTAIALQLLGVTSIVLLYKLPWARWLRRAVNGRRAADGDLAPDRRLP